MTGGQHLVHVFATFGRGGPQMRFVDLLAAMPADWRHTVVAADGAWGAFERVPQGAKVERCPPPEPRGILANVRAYRRLFRVLRPDLVCTSNWGAIEAAWAAARDRIPLVHHEDGFNADEAERPKRRRTWLRRLILRRVRAVVVPSAQLAKHARRYWRLPAQRLHHLVNGVDTERFHPAPGEERPFTYGTVGGLRPVKDQALLLSAFARQPADTRLLLVGDGPLRATLAERAAALGIEDRVRFVGAVADTAPWYGAMDAFVLSSRSEQMPLSLLEAMASGLPVVATRVGDVPAMVPAGQQPLLVPAGSEAALASALGEVRAAASLGAANREHVLAHYCLRPCLEQFVAVYRQAMTP